VTVTLRVQRVLLAILAVLLGVLLATGVVLTFTYRPELAAPWNDLPQADGRRMPIARVAHRWASFLVIPAAVGFFTATLARRYSGGDRRQPIVLTGLLVPLLAAFQFTGYLLPWDQLALMAVRVGSRYRGALTAAFSGDVRFILIGGVEITQGTYGSGSSSTPSASAWSWLGRSSCWGAAPPPDRPPTRAKPDVPRCPRVGP
jgi:quinol-cytochrome oxidoreductase complex cytochrome b subunit